jgi:methionine-S-sulfoxide reductase
MQKLWRYFHFIQLNFLKKKKVDYDNTKVKYEDLVNFFFRMHDPTTENRQGNDVGTQYRSVIFYHSEEQKKIAEKVKKEIDASGKYKNPIVTEITPASKFYRYFC